ncbi:MAG: lipopolysaccharide ABC transporter ATP-binding protein, partial [Deltaproteobacteria bacterium]
VLLVEGRLLESGTPSEIAASQRARAVYLGDRFKLE